MGGEDKMFQEKEIFKFFPEDLSAMDILNIISSNFLDYTQEYKEEQSLVGWTIGIRISRKYRTVEEMKMDAGRFLEELNGLCHADLD